MKIFYLPDLGEGLPEAEIREWFIQEGDEIQADQPMVSMETAKAVVEVPAPRTGRVTKLHGKSGDIISTGAPLVEFEDNEKIEAGTVAGSIEVGNRVIEEIATGVKAQKTATLKALPAVRALAKQLQVDLTTLTPSGPHGQITAEDVKAAIGKMEPKAGYELLHGVRRAMALSMIKSHAEVVPVTLMDDAFLKNDAISNDVTLRIIRAIIIACKTEPSLNAWLDQQTLSRQVCDEVHLGLAMDSVEGLFVPILKSAQNMSPQKLRETINRYKEAVKTRSIAAEDMRGATFVLSNFGTFAGRYATPIIVPPTVAILGVGRMYEQATVLNGQLAPQKVLPLSLTIDHRAVTGGEASRFLAAVIEDLEQE
jgi:2-oxoisovalerate dehydrogenase E2 component (dihydrolipoyl transacylase)